MRKREETHTGPQDLYSDPAHLPTCLLTKSHGKAQHQEGGVHSIHNGTTKMEEGREK